MSPSVVAPAVGESGQPVAEVSPTVEVVPNVPSSVLAKRKRDENTGVKGLKKSTSLPLFFLQFRAPPFFFLSLFIFLH